MAKDQYKYYRLEARELLQGLNQGLLELQKGNPGKDLVGRILRLTHTLKGASRIVKQPGIAELAHAIEDAFAPLREERGDVPQQSINQVLALLDTIAAQVAQLEPARTEAAAATAPPIVEEAFETVRVEVQEIDALLDSASEASVQLSALRHEFAGAARARELATTLFESLTQRRQMEAGGGSVHVNAKALASAEELHADLTRLEQGLVAGGPPAPAPPLARAR